MKAKEKEKRMKKSILFIVIIILLIILPEFSDTQSRLFLKAAAILIPALLIFGIIKRLLSVRMKLKERDRYQTESRKQHPELILQGKPPPFKSKQRKINCITYCKEDAERKIKEADEFIIKNKVLKPEYHKQTITEAEDLVTEAKGLFEEGNYDEALKRALKALLCASKGFNFRKPLKSDNPVAHTKKISGKPSIITPKTDLSSN